MVLLLLLVVMIAGNTPYDDSRVSSGRVGHDAWGWSIAAQRFAAQRRAVDKKDWLGVHLAMPIAASNDKEPSICS